MLEALYNVFKEIKTNTAYTVCSWKSYIASSTYRLVSYLLADRPLYEIVHPNLILISLRLLNRA